MDRKMEICFETTSAELHVIADALDRDGCNRVQVNWYHTRLVFQLPLPDHYIGPRTIELDGNKDGSIPTAAQAAEGGERRCH